MICGLKIVLLPNRYEGREPFDAKRRWEQMGKPEYLSTAMVQELEAASALRSETQAMAYESGQYQVEVAMPPQSVAAILFAG